TALTSPKPLAGSQVPAVAPFMGVCSAEEIIPCLIWDGVRLGTSCFMSAAMAAAFGAAEEVPKKLGRACARLVLVAGSAGNGGLLVPISGCSVVGGKNEVLPPSGAVIVGFWITTALDSGVPFTLKTLNSGP